ncbi:PspC domain-containing protein [Flavobacterium agrisoli]|uniref:PspC domain-containing protein n=1 Tax=Flavobacterium agrisoli TaxID=2793066 RepID=A0A934UKT3_9FLAO|nr:PspC domain-containing protein [Flavobacterium agrisoli]MBK0370844.1 PspC domain-containing protein [Flavobacterium agrisoli]
MNKTVNINLGGIFFHIDEDAYLKLSRYFDAIKRSINNSVGQDEIIKDIEMRISELLSEGQKSDKHVISLKDIDAVIAVMGQPEDYIIEDDAAPKYNYNQTNTSKRKRMYRDVDNKVIGGVATGIAHYLKVDPVWVKIAFVILLFASFGSMLIAYLILYIVIPPAISTSEKLEMTGEVVNISNIEKKVRQEFDNVTDKIRNTDYEKLGNDIKYSAKKTGDTFGEILLKIFKVFAIFLGSILVVTGIFTILSLFIGLFTLGSSTFIEYPWSDFINAGNYTDYPIWTFALMTLFSVGIPFFFLTLLGFKLISPNLKSIGNLAKYTLLALWLVSIAFLIAVGLKQASEVSVENKIETKQEIAIAKTDTLKVKFKYNDYYAKDIDDRDEFRFVEDAAGNSLIYSNDIRLYVKYNENTTTPYIQIEKSAKGNSFSDARKRAEGIQYKAEIVGNELILDNYFVTAVKNKFRDQEVRIYLYLPKGQYFKPDYTISHFDHSDSDIFDPNFDNHQNYIYKADAYKIECLNCPNEVKNEEWENENHSQEDTIKEVSVKINGKEVIKTSVNLTKDKNGVIIKNN